MQVAVGAGSKMAPRNPGFGPLRCFSTPPLEEAEGSSEEQDQVLEAPRWVTSALPALAAGDAAHLDKIKDAGRHTSATAYAVAATRRSIQHSCKQLMRFAHFAHIPHHVLSPPINSFHYLHMPA